MYVNIAGGATLNKFPDGRMWHLSTDRWLAPTEEVVSGDGDGDKYVGCSELSVPGGRKKVSLILHIGRLRKAFFASPLLIYCS